MWHSYKKLNREISERCNQNRAEWLQKQYGGELHKKFEPLSEATVAQIVSDSPIYNYPLMEVWVNGEFIIKVSRIEDARRIMHALKKDYSEVEIRVPYDS